MHKIENNHVQRDSLDCISNHFFLQLSVYFPKMVRVFKAAANLIYQRYHFLVSN
jgi:hypothetical protein